MRVLLLLGALSCVFSLAHCAGCSTYNYIANSDGNGGTVTMPSYSDGWSCTNTYTLRCPSGRCNLNIDFERFSTEAKYDKLTLTVGSKAVEGSPFSGGLGSFGRIFPDVTDGVSFTVSFASDGSNHNGGFKFNFRTVKLSTAPATSLQYFQSFFGEGTSDVSIDLMQVSFTHQERQCSTMTGCGAWTNVKQTAPCGISTSSSAKYKLALSLNDVKYSAPNGWGSGAQISRKLTAKCSCSTWTTLYDFGSNAEYSQKDFTVMKSGCNTGDYGIIPNYNGVKDVTISPVDITLYGDRIEMIGDGSYKILDSKGERTLTYEVQAKFIAYYGSFDVVKSRAAREFIYTPSPAWEACDEQPIDVRDTIAQWFIPGSAEVAVPIADPQFATRIRRCSSLFGCDSWAENSNSQGKGFGSSNYRTYLQAYDDVLDIKFQLKCSSSTYKDWLSFGPVAYQNAVPKSLGSPNAFTSSCVQTDFNTAWSSLLTTRYFKSSSYSTSTCPLPVGGTISTSGTFTTTFTKHCMQVVSNVIRVSPTSPEYPFEYYEAQIAWKGSMTDDSQKIIKAAVINSGDLDTPEKAKGKLSSAQIAAAAAFGVAMVAVLAAVVVVRRRKASETNEISTENLITEVEEEA